MDTQAPVTPGRRLARVRIGSFTLQGRGSEVAVWNPFGYAVSWRGGITVRTLTKFERASQYGNRAVIRSSNIEVQIGIFLTAS
jgi:hypothetical protein